MFEPRKYRRRELTIALLCLAGVPMAPAQSPDLPPGPIVAKVRTACLECHESRIILQQRLSKKLWTREVDKMIRWGAVVDANDHDAVVDYLSANFGTDKPAEPESRVAMGKRQIPVSH